MPAIFSHTFSFLPGDLFSLWRGLHPAGVKGFFLGSGEPSPGHPYLFMSAGAPVARFRAPAPQAERLLKKIAAKKSPAGSPPFPRFVGYLSYEAGRSFDSGLDRFRYKSSGLPVPDVEFFEYDTVLAFDLVKKETSLFSLKPASLLRETLNRLAESRPISRWNNSRGLKLKTKKERDSRFASSVVEAKKLIQAGDIYQANLSVRFREPWKRNPFDFFERLSRRNPSPYACFMPAGPGWIASCSPELLISVEEDRVSTRPIAGTRPRGKTKLLDQALKGKLLLSPKERAEHIMLVDLERNDLGRVCAPGSVRVSERFSVERYSHVMHIVSEVQGRLEKGKTWVEALASVFPGGTITGCPKIKAVEIISRLEPVGRGPFYGSAGFIAWNGDVKFNILIRTAFLHQKTAVLQAGAGIVADSRPEKEYKEVLAKAAAMRETLRAK